MEPALVLRGIKKAFGATTAVQDLNLTVPRGALYGVIGPNGAGKTTSLRLIMSILFADSGKLTVLGHETALAAKDRIGYLPEERGLYRKMRVGAFLIYMAQLKGVSETDALTRSRDYLARLGLASSERSRCEELSKGMQQKVQFAAAIIHRPDLLILDEPFSGLDPVSVRLLRDLILEEHRRGATILLSTHVMSYAEELCQHVVMINHGRKVLDAAVATLRRQYVPRTILFEPLDGNADMNALRRLAEVKSVEAAENGYRLLLNETAEARTAIPRIAAAVPPARIELLRLSLEDVFMRLVADETPHSSNFQSQPALAGALA